MKNLVLSFLLSTFYFTISAQMPKIENGGLVLDNPVIFNTGTDQLKPESDIALNQVKLFLDSKDYITLLRVEGHLASGGEEVKNQNLTEKRALAVCRWLIKNGIDCKRLIPVGFGTNKPIADNSNPAEKSQNNRIEFKMATLKGKAIGGMPVDGGGKVAGDVCVVLKGSR
jgi:OOP family OmpA-OmpF porin